MWFVTTVLTLPTHVLQPQNFVRIFVMIQKEFFTYFSSFPGRSNISIRKTLEKIRKSYSFSENDLKYEITLAKNCVWLLLVAVTSAGFTYKLYRLKPRASRSKGPRKTVVRIESMAGIWSFRLNFVKNLCLHQGFLRCFRDPIRVPSIENQVLRIREIIIGSQ